MDNNKLAKEIFDPIKKNRRKFEDAFNDKLVHIFPSAVKDGQVDFKALLAELGEYVDSQERFELNWAGKTEAKRIANTDIVGKTLKYVPEESKNTDTTENLYIEGDNLEVLKLLRNSYFNKIKMIYIDPPYNTGNDFIYNDKFSMSKDDNSLAEGDLDDERNRLVINQKSNGKYHSNWLSMIYPRLKVAKDLLKDNGLIFISIDDNEVDNLKKVCNEIFGEENFISQIVWEKRFTRSNNAKMFASLIDYILLYRKGSDVSELKEPRNEKSDSIYSNPDNDPRGVWTSVSYVNPATREQRPNLTYPIINPYNNKTVEHPTNAWKYEYSTYEQHVKENKLYWGKNGENTYPRLKKFLSELDGGIVPVNLWYHKDVGTTDAASKQLEELMGVKVFDFPKPVSLIERMLKINTTDDDIVLDFFAGSATTAHAVLKLNAESGQNCKFIMVQVPELCNEKSEADKAGYKNICEIGKERIRRAGEKIKEDYKDKEGIENLDIGFKVFKVGDTNIRWFSEAICTDEMTLDESMMSDKDKLDFNPGYTDIDVVYEILLRHRDIPLSTNVEHLLQIGNRTYIFADTVVVCLEENITDEIIDKIAEIEPLPNKIIFRDSAFGSDISLKENAMLRLEADMKKHSGLEKKTYRVEFI